MTIKAAFTGRVGLAPVQRVSRAGKPFATFSVAVDSNEGENAQTMWVSVSAFGDQVAAAAELQAGESVYVEGRLRLSTWVDQQGRERNTLQVTAAALTVLGRIGKRRPASSSNTSRTPRPDHQRPLDMDAPAKAQPRHAAERGPLNQDIPF